MSNDAVWIRRVWRDTVWALLHNIRIRMSSDVERPSVLVSGSGKTAAINITLPAAPEMEEAGSDAYSGSFAVTYNSKTKKLDVGPGWLCCNGTFSEVAAFRDIQPETGCLCISAKLTPAGTWSVPTFSFTTPAADAFPLAAVTVKKSAGKQQVEIRQYPVTVAYLFQVKICPLAEI